MEVKVIGEWGCLHALFGCGLSYGLTSGMTFEEFVDNEGLVRRMGKVAAGLAVKDPSESKFLRSATVTLWIRAPRFWWSEASTYKIGTVELSESTMHTIKKRKLTDDDFTPDTDQAVIDNLNALIESDAPLHAIKANLPEGFRQARVLTISYAGLRNVIRQRRNHHLPEWRIFCKEVVAQVQHPEFLRDLLPEDCE